MAASVEFISEDIYPDGGYTALVKFYGRQYAVHFVSSEIRIYGVASKRPMPLLRPWQFQSMSKAVKAAVQAHLDAQGPAWMQAHVTLFAEELGEVK